MTEQAPNDTTLADIGYPESDIESPVFLRVSGKAKPKLVAPTNKAFDPSAWAAAVTEMSSQRDFDLTAAALIIGKLTASLRRDLIADLFDALSRQAIIRLGVATANRAVVLTQRKLRAIHIADAKVNPVGHLAALAQERFKPSETSSEMTFDDANTAIVDSLPHWFAEAAGKSDERRSGHVDYRQIAYRGEIALGYEKLLRDVWQEIQWEPWALVKADVPNILILEPKIPALQAKWRAWDWRDQTLLVQGPTLDQHFRTTMGTTETPAIEQTIIKARRSGARTIFTIGAMSPQATITALTRSEFLDNCYLAKFLDEPFPGSTLTVRQLEKVMLVLQDAARQLLVVGAKTELDRYEDVVRFSCSATRASLIDAISHCAAMSEDLAREALEWMISDPAKLSPLFEKGVWHRPLIALDGSDDLLIVAGALWHGSPVRRASLWLKDAGLGDKLSATTQGLAFESDVRDRMAEAISGNSLLKHLDHKVAALKKNKEGEEEIDMLVRVGDDILICEIKSFLGPAEPIERHNYLVKIRGACAQAARKANWFRATPAAQMHAFGAELSAAARILPVVVVNQSSGCGLQYDGVPVTDATFLALLLGSGSYVRGGYLERGKPGAGLVRQTLYESASEFTSALPGLLREPPGVKRFEQAIRWDYQPIKLPGVVLQLGVPVMDQDAYIRDSMGAATDV